MNMDTVLANLREALARNIVLIFIYTNQRFFSHTCNSLTCPKKGVPISRTCTAQAKSVRITWSKEINRYHRNRSATEVKPSSRTLKKRAADYHEMHHQTNGHGMTSYQSISKRCSELMLTTNAITLASSRGRFCMLLRPSLFENPRGA